MAFTAKDVQKLREQTGAGMMDCKKALTSADGDFEKAIEYLREKGLAAAAKKAGRIAAEGAVYAYVCQTSSPRTKSSRSSAPTSAMSLSRITPPIWKLLPSASIPALI